MPRYAHEVSNSDLARRAREIIAEREPVAERAAPAPVEDAAPLGYDWTNAGAVLAITAAVPAVASVILLASNVRSVTDNNILPLIVALAWGFWFFIGVRSAWQAWCGRVSESTVTIRGGEIAGRSVWPIRRWRSARLDQLVRVRYLHDVWVRKTGPPTTDALIMARDRAGQPAPGGIRSRRPRRAPLCAAVPYPPEGS